MSHLFIVPDWFFEFGIFLEILFAIATFIVAVYAYKLYRFSEQRELKLFSASFGFISLSYIIKALLVLFVISKLQGDILIIDLNNLQRISLYAVYFHVVLFMLGVVTLAYMTLKKGDCKIYSFLIAISLAAMMLGCDLAYSFTVVSSLILLYLCIYYLFEYFDNNKRTTLIIFIGFVFLLVSGAGVVFAPNYYLNFVIGHLLELASYILIISSLVLTMKRDKNGKKTNKT
jgi:hypothetical protein